VKPLYFQAFPAHLHRRRNRSRGFACGDRDDRLGTSQSRRKVMLNARSHPGDSTMTRLSSALVLAGVAWIGMSAPATAQNSDKPENAEEGGRYSFHRTGDRFIRLDSRTGAVSQCGWGGNGWSCSAVPDERAALESEIARLQRENAALKKTMLAKGMDLPPDVKPDVAERRDEARKQPEDSTSPKFPSDAELDRAMAFMKNVWRRLVEMMTELQRDMQRKS
jgi:hypothetical protein